jgi:hypothetical protein
MRWFCDRCAVEREQAPSPQIGSTIATSLASKEKAASAIAIMFTGLTVALVTGVPLWWCWWRWL